MLSECLLRRGVANLTVVLLVFITKQHTFQKHFNDVLEHTQVTRTDMVEKNQCAYAISNCQIWLQTKLKYRLFA